MGLLKTNEERKTQFWPYRLVAALECLIDEQGGTPCDVDMGRLFHVADVVQCARSQAVLAEQLAARTEFSLSGSRPQYNEHGEVVATAGEDDVLHVETVKAEQPPDPDPETGWTPSMGYQLPTYHGAPEPRSAGRAADPGPWGGGRTASSL